MVIERIWVLVFLMLPIALGLWQWRRTARKGGLILMCSVLALIILALSEPRLPVQDTKVAAIVLADTSASVSDDDLATSSKIIEQLQDNKGRNEVQVVPFARQPRDLASREMDDGWRLQRTSGTSSRGTNLEAAMRHAAASAPAGMVPRLVLISDGLETEGSAARAAWSARQLGVPVDTYPLRGRAKPALQIEAVSVPATAFTGEKFPIGLTVNSPSAAEGKVELSAEGKVLGSSPVSLQPGSNQLRVHTSLNVAGALELSGKITAGNLGEAPFRHAITLRKPRVLYVSQDPPGTEQHLLTALTAARFEVERDASVARALDDFQLVILNNQDLEKMPIPLKNALERYVQNGGGLLAIAGERNVYVEKKTEDALDRVLPAKIAPPRTPEGTCVVLIMDKSSSMEGRKMDLARVSAIGVVENLRPVDFVGVLIFDNTFQWAVPIRRAEDKSTIKRIVAGVTPDGGTQIAPALAEGYLRIQKSTATFRHIVLLTDGISEEGDSMAVSKEASTRRITISTVGLGQDVNRTYLEKIAENAKGRSYFLVDPSGLEQILLKDVLEHTGTTAVERPFVPDVMKASAVLEDVAIASAPTLAGYVKFDAKPGADVVLAVDKKDPLLAIWQNGLGRSAVFTSDAKSRWAEKWVAWPGFDKFWVNLSRDLLPRAQASEAIISFDPASQNLIAEYKTTRTDAAPQTAPPVFVFGPGGFQQPLPLTKTGEGSWTGKLFIGGQQGLFRVRPLQESRFFPETGLYREEDEMRRYGSNDALLRQLSQYTGGRFSPKPEDVFDSGRRSNASIVELWPALLGAALGLSLLELIMRKWSAVVDSFRRVSAGFAGSR